MSARKLHRVGADPSASVEGARDYDTVRLAIATDLSKSVSSAAISVARLVGDLCDEIQVCLDQGSTYRDVARVFEDHGVDASADAIRVSLRRKANAPRDKAERKVLASKRAAPAPKPPPQVERPLSPANPDAEKISPGSDPEVGEEPRAGPAIEHLPAESDAFSVSPPNSSEPPHTSREPQIGRRLS